MRQLTETEKERVRFEVCHDLRGQPRDLWGQACVSCVLKKMANCRRIAEHVGASESLIETCALEAIYALGLLPAQYDVSGFQAEIESAITMRAGKMMVN